MPKGGKGYTGDQGTPWTNEGESGVHNDWPPSSSDIGKDGVSDADAGFNKGFPKSTGHAGPSKKATKY